MSIARDIADDINVGNVGLPLKDSSNADVLAEDINGVVTLTADAAIIEGSSSGDLVRITQTGSGNALVVEDSANPDSTPFVVNSSGNVGIGTSNPQDALHLSASSPVLRIENTDTNGSGAIEFWDAQNGTSNVGLIRYNDVSNQFQIQGNANGTIFLTPSNTFPNTSEAMRIDSNGTVFFGGGYAPDPDTKIAFYATPTVAGLATQNTSTGVVNKVATFRANNTTEIGHITCSNSSTSFSTTSDYRLKENITDITDGISRVKQLNPSRFNFISDSDIIVDGFIAHEVSDVVPEAITGVKDAVNEDGSINPQGIDQSKLVPLLTAALQEAIELIESQQSQIDTLTTKTQEQDFTIASLISRIEALESNTTT
jgi:hypothetical protein